MTPFATTTTASTALPAVIQAAAAIHSAVPTPQPPLTDAWNMAAPAMPRFKTLLGVEKERFGD